MPLKSCDPLRTRTSGDLFFIRSALSQLNSMLCYITKAPIPQENMSLSLNLKLKKKHFEEGLPSCNKSQRDGTISQIYFR